MKRTLTRTILVLLIAFTMSSCSGRASQPTHHIYFLADTVISMRHYIQAFEESHPDIKVHVFYSRVGDDWPRHYDAALLFSEPRQTSLLQDLTPYLQADKTFRADDFFPGLLFAAHDHGKLVGLPLSMDVGLLLYDTKQFANAGVPLPTSGWTWQDLMRDATQIEKYKARTGKGKAIAGRLRNILLTNWLLTMVKPYREVSGECVPQLNTPEMMTFLTKHAATVFPWLATKASDYEEDELAIVHPADPLIDGRASMTFVSYSWLSRESHLFQRYPRLAYTTLPQPGIVSTGDRGSLYITSALAMSRGSKESQAVWQWFEFLSKNYVPRGETLSARRSLMELPSVSKIFPGQVQRTRLLSAIAADQRSLAQEQCLGAVDIIARHMVALLAGISSGEADAAVEQKQALAEVKAWYKQREETPETFTVIPPVPPSAWQKKQQLRVDDVPAMYNQGAETFKEAFQKKHPKWLLSFCLSATEADAVAEFVESNAFAVPPGSFLVPLLPVEDVSAVVPSLRRDDFLPQTVTNISWRRQLPGLPVAVSPFMPYYDPAIFARLGVTPPGNNWSVADMLAAASELASKHPLTRPYSPQTGYETAFVLEQEGIPLFSDSLVPRFTDESVLQALERLRHLAGKRSFLRGGTPSAIVFGYPFENIPPSYVPAAMLPRPGVRWPLRVSVVGVNKNAEHPDIAWQWAAFVAHHPEMEGDALPALKTLATSDATRARLGPARYDAYMTMLKRIPAEPITDRDILQGAALWWFDRALRQVGPESDLRSVLEQAQAKAQAFLTCTGGQVKDIAQLAACARKVDPEHPLARTAP